MESGENPCFLTICQQGRTIYTFSLIGIFVAMKNRKTKEIKFQNKRQT